MALCFELHYAACVTSHVIRPPSHQPHSPHVGTLHSGDSVLLFQNNDYSWLGNESHVGNKQMTAANASVTSVEVNRLQSTGRTRSQDKTRRRLNPLLSTLMPPILSPQATSPADTQQHTQGNQDSPRDLPASSCLAATSTKAETSATLTTRTRNTGRSHTLTETTSRKPHISVRNSPTPPSCISLA
jgi:hypothetical protein